MVENEIALVVLDPINSFITAKVDAHRDVEIRRVLDPLAHLCREDGASSSLAVVHLNRRTDTDVLNRITGSGGYGGSARSILTFGRHPENDDQRVVAAEGNWQKEAHSDLFELREVIVFPDAAPGRPDAAGARPRRRSPSLDSSDLIDQAERRTAPRSRRRRTSCSASSSFGPVPVADLRRGAEANGHRLADGRAREEAARRRGAADLGAGLTPRRRALGVVPRARRGVVVAKWRYFASEGAPEGHPRARDPVRQAGPRHGDDDVPAPPASRSAKMSRMCLACHTRSLGRGRASLRRPRPSRQPENQPTRRRSP